MPERRPVTQADSDQVRELHAQGLSRNEIARQLGRSGKTVSRLAAEAGLTFERGPEVAAATEARKADAKSRRAALALKLIDDAERLREQLFAPSLVFSFGGRDNVFEQATIPKPTPRDQQAIMSAIGTAVDRSVKLDEYDRDTDGGDAKSVIGDLMTALGQAWRDGQQ